jgi:hypothetical protein
MYALLEPAQEGVHDALQHAAWNGADFMTDGSFNSSIVCKPLAKSFSFKYPHRK